MEIGLTYSAYIQTDDTGARHDGKNGFCTVIGNVWFTWFKSTAKKNRINFLRLLRAGSTDYVINQDALEYMKQENLPLKPLQKMKLGKGHRFANRKGWKRYLANLEITDKRHIKIVTEAALVGSLYESGLSKDLVILSDDAGQFDVLLHALCWIHAERNIKKIVPFTDEQRIDLIFKRDQIWQFYRELKGYQKDPSLYKKLELEKSFDQIFNVKTCFSTLNSALKRLYKNKKELLLLLDRPEIPAHNNGSERDLREYVTRRKVSGGTRSDEGRNCRDTFASLKKNLQKAQNLILELS